MLFYTYLIFLLFYNNKYTINIPVSLKSGTISKKTISNKATTQSKIGTNATTDTYDSNSVNVNVYYYVTVKHLIEGTNQALATEQKIKKYHGDSYTTSMLTNIPSDYEYSSKTSNYTGTATDNITVTYYYKLKKERVWLYLDRYGVYDNAYDQFKHDIKIKDGVKRYYILI